VLVELKLVEQRFKAVCEVLDGATVTDVAKRNGVSRQTVHTWMLRYANEGLGALADRSSKPEHCPHQASTEVDAHVLELRREHDGWGPRTSDRDTSAALARVLEDAEEVEATRGRQSPAGADSGGPQIP
jgi:transposase-like protein